MRPIALGGSGTTLSAACYLYRLRSSAAAEGTDEFKAAAPNNRLVDGTGG